jgi:16S rRNA (guanine(966)-N(2))-methyltransferase RsmD
MSKGIRELTLVENNRDCLLAIKKNIASLALKSCNLYPLEAKKAIEAFHKHKRKFDIIFLDPPYYRDLSKKTLQILGACDILAPYGFIVIQHFKKDNLPETLGDLRLFRQKRYGDTKLSFYRKVISKSQ